MASVNTQQRRKPSKEALELFNGDRLTQVEFHRRYEAQPVDDRFELIGGVWFSFKQRRRLAPDNRGIFRSLAFPGLWLDGPALLARNSNRLLHALEQGSNTEEHAAFVRRLRRRRAGSG